MLPRTIDGMKHVCYFRHALALDERRLKFLPEYAYGGTTKSPAKPDGNIPLSYSHVCSTNNKPPENKAEDNPNTADRTVDEKSPTVHESRVDRLQVKKELGKHKHTMEVWFAGTHSDM